MIELSLLEDMRQCHKCQLRNSCHQVVTGKGNLNAKLVLIGEAPGEDEDIIGEPFVGRSGKLLTKLLLEAGITRDNVYISNTVKCRPPNNRTPNEDEVRACKSWLWLELKNLAPEVIITLGKVPTKLLLQLHKQFSMRDISGKEYAVEYMKALIVPWYHPSYLLRRNNALDKETIEFFKRIKDKINVNK